ncbi:LytR family transcriptional regulator [Leptotrichia sp. OH3620_COT-345]|uniref:LytR C-terminal domain-containing protein n=1 Tax=Leptotrichia sp. OH3620_COT-345 TaxID=2491048 RepID=UPI000F6476DF|nr:LytR C-terminal domain-containing protein [Leptotrichia sp. OH3620_COT-345]RRD40664.1 LytR family transcriptional regulator [Leptotrichia sp. OH3620_COT-345]
MKKILLVMISLLFFISCFENTETLKSENRIFRTGDKYYVYYNGNTFELPKDLYLTKTKKVEQYFTTGILKQLNIGVLNKAELLNDLNKYFPSGIKYITENEQPVGSVSIPVTTVGSEKHVDSIKFEKIIVALPQGNDKGRAEEEKEETVVNINPEETLKGKKIEVLNANGIDGFAKNIGEKLKAKFGLEYNAENYTKPEVMNYVVVRKLNETEVEAIVSETGLKYVKVFEDNNVKPEADFIIITGNDAQINFPVEILTLGNESAVSEKIQGYKPKTVKTSEFKGEKLDSINDIKVIYNPADIYTAKLIAKSIGGGVKLIADNEINGKITVISKN